MLNFSGTPKVRLSERDSSGTTRSAEGARVMERIARREARSAEAARPNEY